MKASQAAAPALALATFVVLACGALLRGSPPAFDASGLAAVHAWRTDWLDQGFRIVTWLDPACKDPRTLHHRGRGAFMVAGETIRLASKAK